jgi:spoIIIJ-associated protein
MKSLEVSARTVEEAIQKALEKLGVTREEVEVTVVKEGKHGVLGLGAGKAKVKVRPLAKVPKKVSEKVPERVDETAKGILEALLARMGIEASVTSQTKPAVEAGGETSEIITLDVSGDDLGILIGRRGQTLSSLQYIVRLIAAHQAKARVPIVIDVEGYKQRRYEALRALARRMAEQVKVRRRPFALEPMPAYERRIIHLTLADDPDVATESVGEGEARKVVIKPKPK